jgi:hypothetical protein
LGPRASIVRLQARVFSSIEFQPILGILISPIVEGEFQVIEGVRREKSKDLAIGLNRLRGLVEGIIILCKRGIVNITTEEVSVAFVLNETNWMIFVSALSTKMNRVQPFVWVFW